MLESSNASLGNRAHVIDIVLNFFLGAGWALNRHSQEIKKKNRQFCIRIACNISPAHLP